MLTKYLDEKTEQLKSSMERSSRTDKVSIT